MVHRIRYRLNRTNWKKAMLLIGVPVLALIGKDLQAETPIRSLVGGALILLSACFANYFANSEK